MHHYGRQERVPVWQIRGSCQDSRERRAWPAIWALGSGMEWPSCGEIDIMEYYRIKGELHILANAAWELTGSGMQDGIVKRFLLLILQIKTWRGRISFTSGVWIGMKRPLKSIWMMNY